jgi:hypothetical protein
VSKERHIVEGFGGFLNMAKQFVAGVGKGALDDTIFSRTEKKEEDIPASVYSAEVLRSAILNTTTTMVNVLAGIDQADKAAAEASAAEMFSFLKDSYKKVYDILEDKKEDGPKVITTQKMNSTLSEISSKLDVMTRPNGILQKWKDEFMGIKNSKFVGKEFLSKGRGLVEAGKKIMQQVEYVKKLKDQIKSKDLEGVVNRSLAAAKGEDTREFKPKTFGKDPEEQVPEIVKEYRMRLVRLGLVSKDSGDTYGSNDAQMTKQAMGYLGAVTGKVYTDSDESLRDFQRDLGIYVDKQEDIKDILGVK